MKTRLRWEATAGDCRDLPTRTNIDICLPTPRSGRLESEICQAASTLPTTTYFHVPLHHPWPALLLGVWPFFSREDLLVLPSSIYPANESPAKVRRWGTANDSRALLTVRPLSGQNSRSPAGYAFSRVRRVSCTECVEIYPRKNARHVCQQRSRCTMHGINCKVTVLEQPFVVRTSPVCCFRYVLSFIHQIYPFSAAHPHQTPARTLGTICGRWNRG